MKLISKYLVIENEGGEFIKLLAQGVFSETRLEKMKADAKQQTDDFIDKGLFLHRVEIYVHSNKARKPYLNRYKV